MILAALTVALVEGRYRAAAAWAAVAATVSATGLMHGYRVTDAAIVNAYGPATTWPFVAGYLAAALLFLVLRSRRGDETRPSPPRR
jgi:AGZA family xanthine/uracil permease-like MFS transporter